MSAGDVLFLLGPVGALLLVPGACVLVLVGGRPKWAMWAVLALGPVAAVSWVAYWVSWGRAFEYADAYQPVPGSVEGIAGAAMGMCASSALALTLVAITSLLSTPPKLEDTT
jgi:hypothetical protein